MSLRDKIQATLSKCRSLEEMIDVLKVATGNGDDTEFETQIVGEIPAEIAEQVPQLIAGPIILDKRGVDHIADRREKLLKNLKMTAVEFVKSIIDGFDSIYTNKDYTDRFQLVCTGKTTSRLAVIGIKKEGNMYRVITAMPKRNARLSKEMLLWEGAANLHAVSAATTPPRDVNSDKVASGENINNSDPDVNSENEKNSEKKIFHGYDGQEFEYREEVELTSFGKRLIYDKLWQDATTHDKGLAVNVVEVTGETEKAWKLQIEFSTNYGGEVFKTMFLPKKGGIQKMRTEEQKEADLLKWEAKREAERKEKRIARQARDESDPDYALHLELASRLGLTIRKGTSLAGIKRKIDHVDWDDTKRQIIKEFREENGLEKHWR